MRNLSGALHESYLREAVAVENVVERVDQVERVRDRLAHVGADTRLSTGHPLVGVRVRAGLGGETCRGALEGCR